MHEKTLQKAQRDKASLASAYHVDLSQIVYIGDNHYIIVKDGGEVRI